MKNNTVINISYHDDDHLMVVIDDDEDRRQPKVDSTESLKVHCVSLFGRQQWACMLPRQNPNKQKQAKKRDQPVSETKSKQTKETNLKESSSGPALRADKHINGSDLTTLVRTKKGFYKIENNIETNQVSK